MKGRIYSAFVAIAGAAYFVTDVVLSTLGVQGQQLEPRAKSKKKVIKKG